MGIPSNLTHDISTVDVVIAGGGTAGCIVAARLSEADPNLSILVLEAGPDGAGIPTVDYPAFFFSNILPDSKTITFHKSSPSKFLDNREITIPTAQVLGGGSSVNMMMYSRAQRADWDSWQVPGWSTNEMLPYLKKGRELPNLNRTYTGPGSMDKHGSSGPIQVSAGTFTAKRCQDDFIAAMSKVGWPELEDLGSLDSCNGVQRAVRFISPDGKRQDTASRYLKPKIKDERYHNLHVIVESQVVRVLFDGKRACGIVYQPKADGAAERTINATKMVIVSCGALGTPAVLERSGVGNAKIIRSAGVSEVVADIPGVGHQYDDHHLLLYSYKTSLNKEETLDGMMSGRVNPVEMIQNNDSMLGWNAQDVTCKLRPTSEDIAALGPAFQEAWNAEFECNPDKPLMMMALVNWLILIVSFPGLPVGIPPGQYMGISTFTTYPFSRGHVHITGPGVRDPLDFDTGFFSDAQGLDLIKHRWAYKKQREVARRMSIFRGEVPVSHPLFPEGSKAALVPLDVGPLEDDVQDIEYSAEDDAIIDKYIRDNVGSAWHSYGTCKMAPLAESGVVDKTLSVYGVEGLKIADLSIVPKSVAANTNNTALAIGEKAADIFIQELDLN
ncbi:alcohol oxidase [Xylariaceae sp. FL0255]|nr:alcohol oxidase [Xylariaceae sp. FL0255]